jgi:hypothetical protein
MARTTRAVIYSASLLVVALLTGCVSTSPYRGNSGIGGAAPGSDPTLEQARGR